MISAKRPASSSKTTRTSLSPSVPSLATDLTEIYPITPQIRDNIALGDPAHFQDDDRVRRAAQLGGAETFIDRLSEGFDTYLERPVRDYFSGIPEGTTTLFGRNIDYSGVRGAGGMSAHSGPMLSGGQMQRLAV